jgi:sarcosine oxidase
LDHEVLSVDEIRARWPQFDPIESGSKAERGGDVVGFYEANAGMLLPENAIESMVHLARRSGAEIRQRAQARSWRKDGGSIIVTTNHEKFHADRLIVTAGAWTAELLPELGQMHAPLRVTRQAMGWYDAKAGAQFSPRSMPCWARVRNEGGFFYGFPVAPGARAIKAALHEVAQVADPDSIDRVAKDADVAVLDDFMPRLFHGEVGPRFRAAICMYTNSPDGHFIIDHLPGMEGRVTVACGFSGHGFKFAPVVGEALADLAMKGGTELPIGFLSLGRFSSTA